MTRLVDLGDDVWVNPALVSSVAPNPVTSPRRTVVSLGAGQVTTRLSVAEVVALLDGGGEP